ncbi:MAG: S41 family peptidase [Cytophagales bacterium]|nr:S41 family peptidase [Cytophagales bacterium]
MRRLFLILLFIPNLSLGQFTNLDFESWDTQSKSFSQWFGTEGAIIQRDTNAFEGEQALRLECDSNSSATYFLQVQKLEVGVPRRMTFSGIVNTQNLDGQAGIYVTVRGPNGRTYYSQDLSETGEHWIKSEIEIVVDDQSDQIYIGGIVTGEGYAAFDLFELKEKALTDSVDSEATQYIDEIGALIRENSLVAGEVDLDRLISLGKRLVSADTTLEASRPVVEFMVNKLRDGHSRFMAPQVYRKWQSAGTSITWSKGEMMDNLAYLEIPGFRSGNARQITAFADHLRKLIEKLALNNPAGWIIDLRKNTGGNAYAMLSGLSPFYPSDTLASMAYRDQTRKPILLKKKGVWFDGTRHAKVRKTKLELHQPRVAVLVGPETASAGELVTISLKSLADVVVIGQPTAGISSNNELFELSDDGALFLTTSNYADIHEEVYTDGLEPDVSIEELEGTDLVLEAAKQWILEKD